MSESKQPANVYDIVTMQESAFNAMGSDSSIKWSKESQFAMQALQANKSLNATAWNNKGSLANAMINVASIGITLNPASKHAYLVPRGNKVCLDISYIGLMHLAQQTGSILWGQAKLVYSSDDYKNTGIDTPPEHNSNPFKRAEDRGEVVGAYCTVKTSDGSYLTEEMNIDELNKIRSASKAGDGPWKTWPEEMMRKSVVKRASKYWPRVDRLNLAIDAVNEHEGIEFSSPVEKEVNKNQVRIDKMNAALGRNLDSVTAVKDAIADGSLEYGYECWGEIPEEDRMALSLAPTKGGIFTIEEANVMRSEQWAEARTRFYEESKKPVTNS